MPNLIPDWLPWMRPAGRLIWGVALLVIGLIIVFILMRRPKPERPATWAECMAGAVGVFALMTLAYAVVPHEWITFSDKYLQWGTTSFMVRSGQIRAIHVGRAVKVPTAAIRELLEGSGTGHAA